MYREELAAGTGMLFIYPRGDARLLDEEYIDPAGYGVFRQRWQISLAAPGRRH